MNLNVDKRHDSSVKPKRHHPIRSVARSIAQTESLNFWLTNRIPRVLLTRLVGWYSHIESPVLTRCSVAVWRLFTDLDLTEAKPQAYRSLRDVFTRSLLPGMRPVTPGVGIWTSPCDALVGASGAIHSGLVLQAKGAPYALAELLGDASVAMSLNKGHYMTLRLTSAMYHRFHAPTDMRLKQIRYISGDVWNVNPVALKRIPSLFCKNERAILHCESDTGRPFLIVAVAAVLVASIRLHAIPTLLSLKLPGNCVFDCDFAARKGEELGWFEQGSTLIVLTPPDVSPLHAVMHGSPIRMGEALLQMDSAALSLSQ